MQMFRKNHDCINIKGLFDTRFLESLSQRGCILDQSR